MNKRQKKNIQNIIITEIILLFILLTTYFGNSNLLNNSVNETNLITGTRYLNIEGMLPFENEVADYIEETNNHVLYRVTPIFEGENLVASGVQMEAYSVEDNGEGIEFNVYCYNNQPEVTIDYLTGESYEN